MKKIARVTILTIIFTLSFVTALFAADTLETFDPGASDVEFFGGFEGIGLDKYQKGLSMEIVYGYGLIENFSASVALSAGSNEYFGDGSAALSFGIFGTPLDTDHFDLDLMLNASVEGAGLADFSIAPGLELNFDLKPDQALWGIYLIIEEVLAGEKTTEDDPTTAAIDETAFTFKPVTALTLGTYLTVKDGHQLFLQFDSEILNNPEGTEKTFHVGNLALGYNVMLNDNIELVNEVAFALPQNFDPPEEDKDFSVAITVGIVVTLPDKF